MQLRHNNNNNNNNKNNNEDDNIEDSNLLFVVTPWFVGMLVGKMSHGRAGLLGHDTSNLYRVSSNSRGNNCGLEMRRPHTKHV